MRKVRLTVACCAAMMLAADLVAANILLVFSGDGYDITRTRRRREWNGYRQPPPVCFSLLRLAVPLAVFSNC